MKTPHRLFRLTVLSTSLMAICAPVWAEYVKEGPFANRPLAMMQDTYSNTKPNVLLILDNSNSMLAISDRAKMEEDGYGRGIYPAVSTIKFNINHPNNAYYYYYAMYPNNFADITRESCLKHATTLKTSFLDASEVDYENNLKVYANVVWAPAGTKVYVPINGGRQSQKYSADTFLRRNDGVCYVNYRAFPKNSRGEYSATTTTVYNGNAAYGDYHYTRTYSLASTLRELMTEKEDGTVSADGKGTYFVDGGNGKGGQRWAVAHLNEPDSVSESIVDVEGKSLIHLDDLSNTEHFKKILYAVQSGPRGGTPSPNIYAERVKDVFINNMNSIQYRCQKNYVLMLTDGTPEAYSTGYHSFQLGYTRWSLTRPPLSQYFYPNGRWYWADEPGLDPNRYNRPSYINGRRIFTMGQYSPGDWFDEYDVGLQVLSRAFEVSDLRTARQHGVDKEGGSWDDPAFKQQNVQTITIFFGENYNKNNCTDFACAFLSKGSSTINGEVQMYSASNKDELKQAFRQALTTAAGDNYASVTPAIVGSQQPTTGIIATTNPSNWSGEIRFIQLAKDGKGNIISKKNGEGFVYKSPSFSSSRQLYGSLNDGTVSKINAQNIPLGNTQQQKNAYYQWLTRDSRNTDANINSSNQVNLRDRCLSKNCSSTALERQMGDIMEGSLLLIDDGFSTDANKGVKKMLVAAANDGMVHLFVRNGAQPTDGMGSLRDGAYIMQYNYMPSAIAREQGENLGAMIQDTADPSYGKTGGVMHRFGINSGMTYVGLTPMKCSASNCSGETQQVLLGGTTGQGGRGAFVLQLGGQKNGSRVGVSADQYNDIAQWDTAGHGGNSLLGYTVGSPVFARYLNNPSGSAYRNDDKAPLSQALPNYSQSILHDALFVAGGYHSNKKPALHIYEATGEQYQRQLNDKGEVSASTSTSSVVKGEKVMSIEVPDDTVLYQGRNGLSAPALVDMTRTMGMILGEGYKADVPDGIADLAYAADYAGNVYRFDFRKAPNDPRRVQKIYEGAGSSTIKDGTVSKVVPVQPIMSAPAIYRFDKGTNKGRYMVVFGTGSDIYQDDLYTLESDNQVERKTLQSVYGLVDDPSLDVCGANQAAGQCQPLVSFNNRAQKLTEQTITTEGESSDELIRVVSDNKIKGVWKINEAPESNSQGWFMNLAYNNTVMGERVVSKPVIVGKTVFFTTRIYKYSGFESGKVCSTSDSEGKSWLMGLNVESGGALDSTISNLGKTTVNGTNVFLSGYGINGIASQALFVGMIESKGNLNDNGEFVNGVQNAPITTLDDICKGRSGGTSGYIFTGGGKDNPASGRQVFCGVEPGNRLHRISWREIF